MKSDGSWKLELRLSERNRQNWISRERLTLHRWELKRQSLHGGAEGR